jgi:DNA repair protein RecO (recombination protein O)
MGEENDEWRNPIDERVSHHCLRFRHSSFVIRHSSFVIRIFPVETITAILINRTRLTETSLIVHWCAEDAGLFKTVAKGALRPKSSFAGRLDLFVTCEIVMMRSTKSDLHQLKEVHLVEPRLTLRNSYPRVLAATYFCKLVELVAERETPLAGVHDILQRALDHLDTHEPTPKLVLRFENKLCERLGLGAIEQGGANLLHDVFHKPMPPQRKLLFDEMARAARKDRPANS